MEGRVDSKAKDGRKGQTVEQRNEGVYKYTREVAGRLMDGIWFFN